MNPFDKFPQCQICGSDVVYFKRDTEGKETLRFACGAGSERHQRPDYKGTFPNGEYAIYRGGPWNPSTGCRNAEEFVRRIRAAPPVTAFAPADVEKMSP